jgi:NAD(P)H-nitrite reductase large subunit
MNMIPRKKPHLVMVGNGMAGMRTIVACVADRLGAVETPCQR